ncbi:archease, partial [Candidatus Woesearchaeota archaeon]|nr:archease [Candidatus Woesearchaeota archaeon]
IEKVVADITVEATGKDLRELLQSAADATIAVMAKPDTVAPKIEKTIEINQEDPEKLLYELIEELIFLKDSDAMVFNKVEVKLNGCTAKAYGDKADPEKQELHQDVKAITMHYFTVEQTEQGWRAQFVLDI